VDKKHIPAEFIDRCRLNPDTLQSPFWAWQGTTVPLPLFRNRYSPSIELSDVSIQWLDLRMGTLFHTAPPTFQAKYGSHTIHQPEHPYEIYAELFSQIPVKTSTDIFQNLQTI
jgi:hypothetical protein